MSAHRTPREETAGEPGTGLAIVTPGALPPKRNSVTADVLRRLLQGERLTGLDAVGVSSTTRLAAVIHRLQRDYLWVIDRTDKAAGCRDGRVSWVVEYSMSPELRVAAAAGAADWCAEVQAARRALRSKAAQARASAERFNAARARAAVRRDPRQGGLFPEGGEP